jgi:hypothetical protein
MGERWPPIYDVETLAATIKHAAETVRATGFWDPEASALGDPWAQGDLVELRTDLPMVDDEGVAVAVEREEPWWLLLGNSCDLTRTLADAPHTVIAPVRRLPDAPEHRAHLQAQKFARTMWVPEWQGGPDGLFVCDLTRPVTLDRRGLQGAARRLARASRAGWVVLHACVVRFLARDDGRFD